MFRLIIVLLSATAFVGCGTAASTNRPTQPSLPAQYRVMPEEYTIYSLVIPPQASKIKLFVILDHTNPPRTLITEAQFRILKPETLSAFQDANKQQSLLSNGFNPKSAYLLISSEELKALSVRDGLINFDKKYPDTDGIWSVSRVGFSPDLTQALVYYDLHCGLICGAGFYTLLVKQGNNWVIHETSMVWIS